MHALSVSSLQCCSPSYLMGAISEKTDNNLITVKLFLGDFNLTIWWESLCLVSFKVLRYTDAIVCSHVLLTA